MVCAGASSVTIASIGDAATGAVCTAECGEEFCLGVGAVCRESYHYYVMVLRREKID